MLLTISLYSYSVPSNYRLCFFLFLFNLLVFCRSICFSFCYYKYQHLNATKRQVRWLVLHSKYFFFSICEYAVYIRLLISEDHFTIGTYGVCNQISDYEIYLLYLNSFRLQKCNFTFANRCQSR